MTTPPAQTTDLSDRTQETTRVLADSVERLRHEEIYAFNLPSELARLQEIALDDKTGARVMFSLDRLMKRVGQVEADLRKLQQRLAEEAISESGDYFYSLAQAYATVDPERSLDDVVKAIDKLPRSDYGATARAYRLQADILRRLGRQDETFAALTEAGRYYSWSSEPADVEQARDCLEEVIRYKPDDTKASWYLADVHLRLSSAATDPILKRRHAERGIEVWNAAIKQSLPDQSSYWAYAVRARLANQQSALLRGKEWRQRIVLWWQAVAMVERLLLITDSRAADWSLLGRLFDQLNLHQNAIKATEKAFELGSDNLHVVDQRISTLCNTGEFGEAIEKIEYRRKLSDDRWLYSFRAWVYLHKGQYEEAKKDIENAYDNNDPDQIKTWDLDLRASIYKHAGILDRAQQDWAAILKRTDEMDIDNLGNYAKAAFGLDDTLEAIRLLNTQILLNDPLEGGEALRDLGLFQLCSGQTDDGRKNIQKGVSLGRVAYSLNFFLAECRKKLSSEEANRVEKLVQARIKELEQTRTCEQELIEAYKTFGVNEDDKGWIRIGIQASLARFYREEGRWREADNTYNELRALESMPDDGILPFPEAQQATGERSLAKRYMRRILEPESKDSSNLKFIDDWEAHSEAFIVKATDQYDEETATAFLAILVNASKALCDQVDQDPSSPIRNVAYPLFGHIKVMAVKYSPKLRGAVEAKKREREQTLHSQGSEA